MPTTRSVFNSNSSMEFFSPLSNIIIWTLSASHLFLCDRWLSESDELISCSWWMVLDRPTEHLVTDFTIPSQCRRMIVRFLMEQASDGTCPPGDQHWGHALSLHSGILVAWTVVMGAYVSRLCPASRSLAASSGLEMGYYARILQAFAQFTPRITIQEENCRKPKDLVAGCTAISLHMKKNIFNSSILHNKYSLQNKM